MICVRAGASNEESIWFLHITISPVSCGFKFIYQDSGHSVNDLSTDTKIAIWRAMRNGEIHVESRWYESYKFAYLMGHKDIIMPCIKAARARVGYKEAGDYVIVFNKHIKNNTFYKRYTDMIIKQERN